MYFLVLSRAAAGAAEHDDDALNEAHWAYMDGFAGGMLARGPLLGADRETWAGSMHIVDLPDAAAARAFAEDEPYQRAGLFAEHVIRRFADRLGRTMWEFPGPSSDPLFLVVAHADDPLPDANALGADRLIVAGELRTPDEGRLAGIALALQAPSREAVAALLDDRLPGLEAEIWDWRFGGRPT